MKYIIKKLLTLILTLFFISVLVFLIFQVIPGDPALSILGTEATEEQVEALREQLGLNDSMPERYFNWFTGVLTGDLGRSYRYQESLNEQMEVSRLIAGKLPVTLTLAGLSLLIIIIFSIPIGILWGGTKSRFIDGALNVLSQFTMSVPSFFLGIIIIYLFGLIMRWFTPGGYISYKEDFRGYIRYMLFPAITVALPKAAMTAKFLRNSIITQLKSDYVRTAYSKGARRMRVLFVHVLRNAMIPVVTFIGVIAAEIAAGSIVVEQVFGLPGIGRLLVSSISTRDYPVVQALMLYIVFAVVIVYFIVDVLYRYIDPRVEEQ
ncbi:MAG TPA: ABC transporter permease [Eubacterium sp.]|nr:ABC transporter permease [Eubacterium sp.]HAZ87458.1 ABC transporter permease [Eubacterium sp.]